MKSNFFDNFLQQVRALDLDTVSGGYRAEHGDEGYSADVSVPVDADLARGHETVDVRFDVTKFAGCVTCVVSLPDLDILDGTEFLKVVAALRNALNESGLTYQVKLTF